MHESAFRQELVQQFNDLLESITRSAAAQHQHVRDECYRLERRLRLIRVVLDARDWSPKEQVMLTAELVAEEPTTDLLAPVGLNPAASLGTEAKRVLGQMLRVLSRQEVAEEEEEEEGRAAIAKAKGANDA